MLDYKLSLGDVRPTKDQTLRSITDETHYKWLHSNTSCALVTTSYNTYIYTSLKNHRSHINGKILNLLKDSAPPYAGVMGSHAEQTLVRSHMPH